jgi:hypothetical protein
MKIDLYLSLVCLRVISLRVKQTVRVAIQDILLSTGKDLELALVQLMVQ